MKSKFIIQIFILIFLILNSAQANAVTGNEIKALIQHLDAHIGHLNQLIAIAFDFVSLLEERRSALISAAVTGQIDVRGLVPGEEIA